MLSGYIVLAGVIAFLGVLTAILTITVMAIALLRPPRMTDGKAVWVLRRMSPGDLGLSFEEVHFNVRDEQNGQMLKIAGWWIPSAEAGGNCVVLLHGYADAKVGAIAWAPLWNAMHYNVLAIDLRAHGESGGIYSTAGFWERHDLCQLLDQLRAERPADTRRLVLFGVSLGAATAIATGALRDDLSALVLESPPADFSAAAMSHMDRLGAPGRFFQRMALLLAQRIAHCRLADVRPVELLPRVHCPVLIISPDDDPMVSQAERTAMREALESRHRPGADGYWSVNTRHMLALHADPTEYDRRLGDFLNTVQEQKPK
jgi:hypothetical protein